MAKFIKGDVVDYSPFSCSCQKDKNSVIWFYKENKMSNLFSVFSSTGRSADW
ncbi:MAG: hypothetical protein H8D39_00960 [Candidatus Atribacteria bacterium]|nr:hypothetical protein [Candidatus Atribacteria bacterium]